MIFTDTDRNIKIEIVNISFCKLMMIDNDVRQLEGNKRLLNAYVREAPLDGGTPVEFEYKLCLDERYIALTGNLINAIKALHELDRLSDNLRDDIIEHIILSTTQQGLEALSTLARQQVFSHKLKENLPPSPHSSAPSSPKLFPVK